MPLQLGGPEVQGWLDQFAIADRARAEALLRMVRVVDNDEFAAGMRDLIQERLKQIAGPVAFYRECEIRKGLPRANGELTPNALFLERKIAGRRRATGKRLQQVRSGIYARKLEVGSEGIIGSLITQVGRLPTAKMLRFEPGPDVIRADRVRRCVVVTDFVGSGSQVESYLTSLWKSASLRSWSSRGHVRLDVICFAATEEGRRRIEMHPSRPQVFQKIAAPTIKLTGGANAFTFLDLIKRYGPRPSELKDMPRLGYGSVGALIAFGHGMPNNCPALFFKAGKQWQPLFPGRTTDLHGTAHLIKLKQEIDQKLIQLHDKVVSQRLGAPGTTLEEKLLALVLLSCSKSPRSLFAIAARTGLAVSECELTIERLKTLGLLDAQLKLTGKALQELDRLRARQATKVVFTKPSELSYVPNRLRRPV